MLRRRRGEYVVRIATEPVISPAATFSAISDVLEMIETAAARERLTVIGPTGPTRFSASDPFSAIVVGIPRQPVLERARGAAAVRDRVLLGV